MSSSFFLVTAYVSTHTYPAVIWYWLLVIQIQFIGGICFLWLSWWAKIHLVSLKSQYLLCIFINSECITQWLIMGQWSDYGKVVRAHSLTSCDMYKNLKHWFTRPTYTHSACMQKLAQRHRMCCNLELTLSLWEPPLAQTVGNSVPAALYGRTV